MGLKDGTLEGDGLSAGLPQLEADEGFGVYTML